MSKKGDYKIGDHGSSGQEIATILGQSSLAVVYTTSDNHLRWEYFAHKGAIPNWLLPALTSFDSLMSKVKQVLPEQYRADAFVQLGKHLFTALNITDEKLYYDVFGGIRQDIYLKASEPLRLRYIVSSIVVSIILAGIFIPLSFAAQSWHREARHACLIPLFGCLGSILSVLQRSASLDIDPFSSHYTAILQGSIRAGLGLLCGIFLLVVIKANLLLGNISGNTYVIAVFATVAGFSERFVPDIIKSFETMPRKGKTTKEVQ